MPKEVLFEVAGPFELKCFHGPGGRVIRAQEGTEFFERHEAHALRKGCYVFAVRTGGHGSAGGSLYPWYVGKATKSFRQECFADHKLSKYSGSPLAFALPFASLMMAAAIQVVRRRERPIDADCTRQKGSLHRLVG